MGLPEMSEENISKLEDRSRGIFQYEEYRGKNTD